MKRHIDGVDEFTCIAQNLEDVSAKSIHKAVRKESWIK